MTESKIFPVRIDIKMYKDLRKLSYLTEMSMSDLIREGINLKIAEHRKVLTNAEIVV